MPGECARWNDRVMLTHKAGVALAGVDPAARE
jgi:hypothetical protein